MLVRIRSYGFFFYAVLLLLSPFAQSQDDASAKLFSEGADQMASSSAQAASELLLENDASLTEPTDVPRQIIFKYARRYIDASGGDVSIATRSYSVINKANKPIGQVTAKCWVCERLASHLAVLEDHRTRLTDEVRGVVTEINRLKAPLEARVQKLAPDNYGDETLADLLVPGASSHALGTDDELLAYANRMSELMAREQALYRDLARVLDNAAETLRRFDICESKNCPAVRVREAAFRSGKADVYWEAEQANNYTGLNIFNAFALRDDLTDDFLGGGAPPAPPPEPSPDPTPTPDPAPMPDPDPDPDPDPVPDPAPEPAPDPEPTPDPQPTPGMLVVSGMPIDDVHEVGSSFCPQPLGIITLSNTGETALNFDITGVASWLSIAGGPGGNNLSGSLAPGETREFAVEFTCADFSPFPTQGNPTDLSATLVISTSTADASGGGQIAVDLRVQDEE